MGAAVGGGGGGGSVKLGLLHYPQKLLLVDLPVTVLVRLVDHLLKRTTHKV